MNIQYASDLPSAVRAHVADICLRVQQHAPDAEFLVYEGDDPAGTYIAVISDTIDGFDVLAVVTDRITDLLLQENVAVHVVPVHRQLPAPDDGTGTDGSQSYRPLSIDLIKV